MSAFLSQDNSSKKYENGHWQSLLRFTKQSNTRFIKAKLNQPPPFGIPDRQTVTELLSLTGKDDDHREILEKHLLCGLLLTPLKERENWPAQVISLIGHHLHGADCKTILAATWWKVPIPVVHGETGRLVFMLFAEIATGHGCHCLTDPAPNEDTKKTISTALATGSPGNGFLYWFLQNSREKPVSGKSLGLPVGLGAYFSAGKRRLRNPIPWPAGLYATGELAPDMSLVKVDHVDRKFKAVKYEVKLFLVPAGTGLSNFWEEKIFEQKTFADACFAAELHIGGIPADKYALYKSGLHSSEQFFDRLHQLPEFELILSSEQGKKILKEVVGSPKNWLKKLNDAWGNCIRLSRQGEMLASLFYPQQIITLVDDSTPEFNFVLFEWCLNCFAFFNHSGQNQKSEEWGECLDKLQDKVDRKEITDFLNKRFVSQRFNRYDFRLEPPPDFKEILTREEKRHHKGESNYLLGALYGTLAQNYGFCGNYDGLRATVTKAKEAFARKHQSEAKRGDNYLVYGMLDNQRFKDIIPLLNLYLDIDDNAAPRDWLNYLLKLIENKKETSFLIALIIRVLSDYGKAGFVDKSFFPEQRFSPGQLIAGIIGQSGHPWQLSNLNLGRFFTSVGFEGVSDYQLEQLFRHSLAICGDDDKKSTMYPMALLAMSELHTAGLAGEEDYRKVMEIREWLATTDLIHASHFQLFVNHQYQDDGEKLLDLVKQERQRLFPFNYR